jgi:hypothetical protein
MRAERVKGKLQISGEGEIWKKVAFSQNLNCPNCNGCSVLSPLCFWAPVRAGGRGGRRGTPGEGSPLASAAAPASPAPRSVPGGRSRTPAARPHSGSPRRRPRSPSRGAAAAPALAPAPAPRYLRSCRAVRLAHRSVREEAAPARPAPPGPGCAARTMPLPPPPPPPPLLPLPPPPAPRGPGGGGRGRRGGPPRGPQIAPPARARRAAPRPAPPPPASEPLRAPGLSSASAAGLRDAPRLTQSRRSPAPPAAPQTFPRQPRARGICSRGAEVGAQKSFGERPLVGQKGLMGTPLPSPQALPPPQIRSIFFLNKSFEERNWKASWEYSVA